MKINVIGVPLNLGCDRKGVEKAPNYLRERGLMDLIRSHGHKAFDLGNLYVPAVKEEEKFLKGNRLKYLDAIVEVNNNLAELVYDTLRGGAFPLVIGGDHSLGLGSASGVGMCYDDFGIIWLDAHGDINTGETSPSGNIHGMPLSALMGLGSEELVNVYSPGNKVIPQNVFLVGTRSLDDGESDLIEEQQLSVYTMDTIRDKGMEFVAEDIKNKLRDRKIRNVHFSIDVDSIDPGFAPGTGTRVPDGLTPDEFKEFVRHMLSTNLIKSLDLVELNPDLDTDDKTTRLCLSVIDYITSRL
nr:arginase [uncultured Macellibacteroides sp.]